MPCYTRPHVTKGNTMRSKSLLRSLAVLALASAAVLPLADLAAAKSRSGGVVYFNRPASFAGAFTRPHVIIDGKKVGTIGSGECHGIRLPAGRHNVLVRDQRGLLSALGLELNAARIHVENGSATYIDVRPLQEAKDFNEGATTYNLLVSDSGTGC